MWDLAGPGLEPECPTLAGGFLTAAPSEKPYFSFLEVDAEEIKERGRDPIYNKKPSSIFVVLKFKLVLT